MKQSNILERNFYFYFKFLGEYKNVEKYFFNIKTPFSWKKTHL